jgi:crotonobetainyl-CoA:carnitine CoA-transferase CaiB-like acyl-CoA transferase
MGSGQILDGVRVVDMTQYLSGPTVTRLLAEHGADIVKVERAPFGDPTRTLAFQKDGRSGYFVQQNRGKRSLCIDFDDPAGREVLDALIARADVLVENYGPGVMERRGLDWTTLHDAHPQLIVASISGFGKGSGDESGPGAPGPMSHKTAFDLIAQAYSGLLYLTGPADDTPTPVSTSYADVMSGVHAVAGIGLALFHRERTGEGQHIDIAMVDSLFHAHELSIQGPSITKGRWTAKRMGARSTLNTPQGVYPTADGFIVVQVMQAQWAGFCRAMDRPDLVDDERFAGLAGRHANRVELNALVEEWTRSGTSDVVLARLEQERVPCAPVLAPHEAIGHPYFEARGMVRVVDDPIIGPMHIPGNPLRMSAQPCEPQLTAPLLGEHNTAVLRELGFGDDRISSMEAAGVLVTGPT